MPQAKRFGERLNFVAPTGTKDRLMKQNKDLSEIIRNMVLKELDSMENKKKEAEVYGEAQKIEEISAIENQEPTENLNSSEANILVDKT